jgi:predicted membrane protein
MLSEPLAEVLAEVLKSEKNRENRRKSDGQVGNQARGLMLRAWYAQAMNSGYRMVRSSTQAGKTAANEGALPGALIALSGATRKDSP